MTIQRYDLAAPFLNEAAAYGGIVYLAGLAADDLSQDIGGQTKQTLAYIDRVLAQAGSKQIENPESRSLAVRHGQFRRHERGVCDLARSGERAAAGLRRVTFMG